MKLMYLTTPTKKTGVALLALLATGLLALTFLSVTPSVSSVQAATAIAEKAQGCTGSAQPPTINNLYIGLFVNNYGFNGWTVKSFNVSSFSYINSTGLKVTGLHFIGSYFQSYRYSSWSAYNNKTTWQTTVYEGTVTVSISSLNINRNSTTFSASMSGLTVAVSTQDNSTNVWRHTTISGSNSDFNIVWSCTQ